MFDLQEMVRVDRGITVTLRSRSLSRLRFKQQIQFGAENDQIHKKAGGLILTKLLFQNLQLISFQRVGISVTQPMRLNYLKAKQNAEVPRRPVIQGVNQINTFVRSLLQGLVVWLLDVHGQLWLLITVFTLCKKHSG